MSKAVTCPVCNGAGKITKTTADTAGGTFEVTCHGCGGKGWVEVAEDTGPYYPYIPAYPQPEPYYPPYNPEPYIPYYPYYPYIAPWYTVTCNKENI